MERIIQEKISADHLLYVSLKYTKTADVIMNLLDRWRSMIEMSTVRMLEVAKKKKLIKSIPAASKMQVDLVREIYKKAPEIMQIMDLYEFFKKIETLEKLRENEFRKNVTLKVLYRGEWISIDIEKLKEYSALLERFISYIKQLLA